MNLIIQNEKTEELVEFYVGNDIDAIELTLLKAKDLIEYMLDEGLVLSLKPTGAKK